jgi:hypothetical protein
LNHKPNFFIIGAPKCGTTALSEYLREHPNVFMSNPKEPNYFCKDFFKHIKGGIRTESAYLDLFKNVGPNHIAVGEASVWYLYSQCAVSNIRDFNPNVRLIAMLRNPVDLIYSLHSQFLFNQTETETDFIKAWDLQEKRLEGIFLPKGKEVALTQYRKIGMLGEQVDRLMKLFPKERIKIILFDDFTRSTKKVYRSVLRFLDLPDDKRDDFKVINSNKTYVHDWLKPITKRPPHQFSFVFNTVKRVFGLGHVQFRKKIIRLNTVHSKRPAMPQEFRAHLSEIFKPDIERLESIILKDLSAWRN